MSYGLQASGGGFWDTNSTYDQPVYPETVTSDIATQSQQVQTTPSNDSWSSWFKDIASGVVAYNIKKDAVLTGVEINRNLSPTQANPVTTYPVGNIQQTPVTQAKPLVISSNMMLLVAVGVGVYLLTK